MPFKTYDCLVTATDPTTGLTDQYELVFYTDISNHGYSMAAASSWQSIDETTTSQSFQRDRRLPAAPRRLLRGRAAIPRSAPRERHAHHQRLPRAMGFAYPAWQQFQYVPNLNFCGLDTVRAHLSYYAYDNGNANDIVGPFKTNTATAAIQVAPLLRIVGSSVPDERNPATGRPKRASLRTKTPWSPPNNRGSRRISPPT